MKSVASINGNFIDSVVLVKDENGCYVSNMSQKEKSEFLFSYYDLVKGKKYFYYWSGTCEDGFGSGKGTLTIDTVGRTCMACTDNVKHTFVKYRGVMSGGVFDGKVDVNPHQSRTFSRYFWYSSIFTDYTEYSNYKDRFDARLDMATNESRDIPTLQSLISKYASKDYIADAPEFALLSKSLTQQLSDRHKIEIRHTVKDGFIGDRYVPEVKNTWYDTETVFYVDGKPVTKTTPKDVSTGGYNEKVKGYTSVFGVSNESNSNYIVDLAFQGTVTTSKYLVKDKFMLFFYKSVLETESTSKFLRITRKILLRPGQEYKDQMVQGERYSKNFDVYLMGVTTVDNGWVKRLDYILNTPIKSSVVASNILRSVDDFLADKNAEPWHTTLVDKKQSAQIYLAKVDLAIKLLTKNNYDPDFSNNVTVSVTNKSNNGYMLEIDIADNTKVTIDVKGKSTATKVVQ